MSDVLITGGAGYIGSILAGELLDATYNVTVLDNFEHGVPSLAHLCSNPYLTIVNGDVRDYRAVAKHVAAADIVIPLAGVVGMPACARRPVDAVMVNQEAVVSMCKMLAKDQVVVIPTTNSGYGIGGDTECDENSPLNPLSLYGRTKVAAEAAVMDRENSISLRLATVFGMSPRMRFDLMVNEFVLRAALDRSMLVYEGNFRRNFVHVSDVAAAFLHSLGNFIEMRGRVYNVGDSRANMTKLELCAAIQRRLPDFNFVEAKVGSDPDKRDYVVSNARMEATGWRPERSLNDGIVELISGVKMLKQRFSNA